MPPLPHSRRMPSNALAVLVLADGCSIFQRAWQLLAIAQSRITEKKASFDFDTAERLA